MCFLGAVPQGASRAVGSMSCRGFIGGLIIGGVIGLSSMWVTPPQASRGPVAISTAAPLRPVPLGGGSQVVDTADAQLAQHSHPIPAPAEVPPRADAAGTAASSARAAITTPATAVAAGAGKDNLPHDENERGSQRRGSYWSVGKLRALPAAVDIAGPGMAQHVADLRSYRKEIIMFTSDNQMGGWAYHWVNQMRRWGYEHHFILGDAPETCATLSKGWAPMVAKHQEEPLSCVWSSFPWGHPGWEQWKPRGGEDSLHHVYILWASRWWVSWQLLAEGVNVLSMDVDAVLLTDIYELLRQPPLSKHDVIISRNSDESQSLNCGFVYFNRQASRGRTRKGQAKMRDLCVAGSSSAGARELAEAADYGGGHEYGGRRDGAGSRGGVPAAEWVARAMWERIELFLDVQKRGLRTPPVREVLWEQDAWNDLAKTLEMQRRVFPWAVGYGKDSDLWPTLGYERHVVGGMKHEEKWVRWQRVRGKGLPTWAPPAEANADRFYDVDLRKDLLWLPLCTPLNESTGAAAPIPGGAGAVKTGIGFGMTSDRPLLPGKLLVAPTWLSSLGTDPEADWADSSPPAFAYLHLTNLWHCFPHMCWSKAGRLFWLRAHRFWDKRLDELGITPRGAPYDRTTKALSLPPTFFSAVEALTLPHNGDLPFVRAPERWLAYRRMHGLIHNLVTVAALLNRKPVIPDVPCEDIRTVQQRPASTPSRRSRFGVSHPSVVVTGSADKQVCRLAPGTWRPGGPDQCYHNRILSQFDYDDFLRSEHLSQALQGQARDPSAPLPALALPSLPAEIVTSAREGDAAHDMVSALRKLCEEAARHANDPLLQLDGLLPIRDFLLDAPVGVAEFASERERLASGKPRWRSLLQHKELHALADACPGAAGLIAWRKACVGYFLAE